MRLIIQTAEEVLFDEDNIRDIRLPMGDGGSIGVHPEHHPLIGEIGRGLVMYGQDEPIEETAVEAGIVLVEKDVITIFTSGWLDEEQLSGSPAPVENFDRLAGLLGEYGQQP